MAIGMDWPTTWVHFLGHLPTRLDHSCHRASVLLIEDSEDDVFFFRHTLKKSGLACDLVHVADGAQALLHLTNVLETEAEQARPDLIFLDLKLPSFSGFEILAWLRARQPLHELKVVILSGSDVPSDRERARQLGARDYLVKPLTVDQLRSCLAVPSSTPAAASTAQPTKAAR